MAVTKVTGPLGPRRAIAAALKQLRDNSGESLNDAAAGLMISTSKLSRLENAQGRPLPRDIRDVIVHYKIEGTSLAGDLRRWVADAQRPPPRPHPPCPRTPAPRSAPAERPAP